MNGIGQRTDLTTAFDLGAGVTSNPGDTDWGYDSLGQLTSADAPDLPGEGENDPEVPIADRAYEYDAIGNRKKMAAGTLSLPTTDNYTTNALNQYTVIPALSATPAFDDDGNATAYPLPAYTSANSALTWDAENRLTSVTVNSVATTYLYDALSRR